MKAVPIASLGLVALFILAPGASAQAPFPTIKAGLVQKVQPVFHSYPGVSADILGIRTGMPIAKAEALAEKRYPRKLSQSVSHASMTLLTYPFSPPAFKN